MSRQRPVVLGELSKPCLSTDCKFMEGCALHVGTPREKAVVVPEVRLKEDGPRWKALCATYVKGRRSNGPCSMSAPASHVS